MRSPLLREWWTIFPAVSSEKYKNVFLCFIVDGLFKQCHSLAIKWEVLMDVKVNKNGSKTIQIKAATHRKLKRAAGESRLFMFTDRVILAGLKAEAAK